MLSSYAGAIPGEPQGPRREGGWGPCGADPRLVRAKGCRLSGDEEAGQRSDLECYRETGHLILDGKLATTSIIVVITPYAQERMRRRDIDESEVLEALA